MGAPTAGLQAWSADEENTGPSLSLSTKKGPSRVCPERSAQETVTQKLSGPFSNWHDPNCRNSAALPAQ